MLAMGWSPVWLVLAGVIFGASYAVMWLGVRTPAKQRAIYFARGGEIFSPYGLFDGSRVEGAWKTKLGDIANLKG